jgi:hypothetical protein
MTSTTNIRMLEEHVSMERSSIYAVEYTGFKGRTVRTEGYIFDGRDCKRDPAVFLMQKSACLQGHYSEEDIAHINRIRTETPIRHGDVVQFKGQLFTVKILGNYSDCGRLVPYAE